MLFFLNVTIMATFYVGEGFANSLFSYTIYYYLVTLPPNMIIFFSKVLTFFERCVVKFSKAFTLHKGCVVFIFNIVIGLPLLHISTICCLLGVDPNDCSMPWMTQHLYCYHHKNLKPIFIYYSFKWDKIGHSHMIIFIHFIFHPNFLTRKHYTCRFAY
jgi:hypothetical protein